MPATHFFIDAHGPDNAALAEGFRWLLARASQRGARRAAVYVPSLRQAEAVGRVIGPSVAKALKRDRQLTLDGITVELLLASRPPREYSHGPLLAVWVDDQELDRVEALLAPAICVVPWRVEDIEGWIAARHPTDVRSGEAVGTGAGVSPTVAAALESLSGRVNLSTGLAHPMDKAAAVSLFKILLEGSEAYDADQVRTWAVQRGWSASDARELADIARRLQERRTVRTQLPGRRWADDILDQWRESAAGSPGRD